MKIDAKLTVREWEVAGLLACGATSKEVAQHLCRAYDTINNHRRNIFEKTECETVAELSTWWFCRRYHLSIDLLPWVRHAVTGVMLVLVLLTLVPDIAFSNDNSFVRATRGVNVRGGRCGRRAKNGEIDIIIN